MLYSYKLDENILKTLIQRKIFLTDTTKKQNLSYNIMNLKLPT